MYLRIVIAVALLLAAATTSPVAAAELAAHTLIVDGTARTYTVCIPAGYDGRRPLPVVVMLHGAGATGRGVIAETGWDRKADREGFLAVFPDAMRADPSSPPAYLTNPQLWNDGSGRSPGFLQVADDVRFLDQLSTDLAKKYSVDTRAVFLTGFSAGASLAFRAAALLPGRFAAIAPVAGPCWPLPSAPPPRPVPTLFIAGTADPINPLAGGTISLPWGTFAQPPLLASLQGWAGWNGCTTGLKHVTGQPGIRTLACPDGRPLRVCLIEGLGHIWPGGEPQFPAAFIGTDPGAMRATDAIWAFFAAVMAQKR
jgi:polyhydroxybutyrate depolymerase